MKIFPLSTILTLFGTISSLGLASQKLTGPSGYAEEVGVQAKCLVGFPVIRSGMPDDNP
jgi:hypothetical protein